MAYQDAEFHIGMTMVRDGTYHKEVYTYDIVQLLLGRGDPLSVDAAETIKRLRIQLDTVEQEPKTVLVHSRRR